MNDRKIIGRDIGNAHSRGAGEGGPVDILLVEDDDGDARLLQLTLKSPGFTLSRVENLSAAVTFVEHNKVDVVLLDLSLPDAEGFETISTLRNAASELPVVVLTGLDDEKFAIQAIRAGAQDYHVKGQLGGDTLPRILHHAIERQRTQVALERRRSILAARVREKDSELKESEERFRLLVEAIEDYAILMLDPDGHVVSWNAGVERSMGYRAEEIIGKHLSCFYSPEAVEKGEPQQALEYARSTGRFEQEGWRRRKDATGFYAHMLLAAIREGDRSLRGFAMITRDITDLIDAQQRALQAERLVAIGQMVTGLAHESRNALQRIQSTVNRITRKAKDEPEILTFVADIEKAGDDLRRLYEEVRGYAAPIILDRKECNVREVWEEVWKHLQPSVPDGAVKLVDHTCDINLRSDFDRFRLAQVFRNVFENAIDAAGGNPLTIEISCSETLHRKEPAIRISIADDGPGLNEEQVEKIFNPFFTTKTRGTGLGMAIVKRIVEAHGGLIEVVWPREKGAEVAITLPINCIGPD